MDVHGRQVLYLLLGDAEPDTVVDPSHGADRDSHFLAAPKGPLLKEHVSNVVIARVDDQALDSSDGAVRSMDLVAAAHGDLAQGDFGNDDGLRDASRAHTHSPAQTKIGPGERLSGAVARVAAASRQEPRLFRPVELLELRQSAAEPDLVGCGVDKIERNKSANSFSVLRFNHEMGDCPSNGVNDHTGHLATEPIGTAGVNSDREL